MIFKEVERLIKASNMRITAMTEGTAEHDLEELRLSAYHDLIRYIKSGVWAKRKSASERVFMAMSKGYEEAAKLYNCSTDSVKSSVWNASHKIEQTIGFDFLSEVEEASNTESIKAALRLFELRTDGTTLDYLFPKELFAYLPTKEEYELKKVNIDSLIFALNRLKRVSIRYLAQSIMECDDDALFSIFHVLSSKDSRFISAQGIFYQYILSMLSEEELRERLATVK